jgi:dTDP-4-dehydrorhamnose reductase
MDEPRLLVVGESGQVGSELVRRLKSRAEVIAIDSPEIDLAMPDSYKTLIANLRPDAVINAAAYTAVDQAESDPGRCRAINATAPGILAEQAAKAGALMVHFSTDYIFDGTARTPYVETDTPNPLSAYGRSKHAGDCAVRAAAPHHLIFRLCWVYSGRGKNFFLTIRRLAAERDVLRVVDDQIGCPTWAGMIADAVATATLRCLADGRSGAFDGTYHLAARGATTWHDFAEAIVATAPEASRRCRRVEPISTGEFPAPARRPAYSVLCCGKFESTFGIKLPDWELSFRNMLESLECPAPVPAFA